MAQRRPEIRRIDPEHMAAEELRRRVRRVRLGSLIACMAPFFGGVLVFALTRQDTAMDAVRSAVEMLAALGFFAMVGAFVLGMSLSQRILRSRLDGWIDEVAERYRVPRKDLLKYATPWR